MPLHRGKVARDPTVIEARALTRDDLALIPAAREVDVNRVQKLRDPHHRLARFLAAGLRMGDAATKAGYSYNRAATLTKDPAFMELVAKYRDKVTESFVESADTYHELLFGNMVRAERMVSDVLDSLDESDDGVQAKDLTRLLAVSRDAADRTGYGKRQMNLNVNMDFAAKLEATIARSRQIEGRVSSAPSLAPRSPGVDGPAADAPGDSNSVPATAVRRI